MIGLKLRGKGACHFNHEPSAPMTPELIATHIAQSKQSRKDLDHCLQCLRENADPNYKGLRHPDHAVRSSRERSMAITKIQEAIMWLGMDLKAINEENPQKEGAAESPRSILEKILPTLEKIDVVRLTAQAFPSEQLAEELGRALIAAKSLTGNPYPESYNPASQRIEPTSEGLKL